MHCCPPRDHLLPASSPASVYRLGTTCFPPRHHLLPASRPPAARLDTGERVLPRHHLLPASRPASVYRGVFDHIYIACPPDSRNPFAWLPQKNIFDGLDYGTLAAIEQSLQKRPGRRAVPPPRRRGNRGKRRSRNASRRLQHTRFWHMTALAHDGW